MTNFKNEIKHIRQNVRRLVNNNSTDKQINRELFKLNQLLKEIQEQKRLLRTKKNKLSIRLDLGLTEKEKDRIRFKNRLN